MTASLPKVSINLVVMNGENFIRHSLRSIKEQSYPQNLIEINILDNGSTDKTKEIIREELEIGPPAGECDSGLGEFSLVENPVNIGFWAGQEKLFGQSEGEIIVATTDVILDKNFLKNAVAVFETDPKIGAIQAKIYQMELYGQPTPVFTDIIDTVGFVIFKSRRIINLGHGDKDNGQFNDQQDIFAVEGAVPIFRRTALENCKINGRIIDPDYRAGSFGYGDDLDLAWRMRLFGWKQILAPAVIAYHDRSTTKNIAKHARDYLSRIKRRSHISIQKRRLDWRNVRFTIIKNDYIINLLKDLPQIVFREAMVLIYSILFEPKVLFEIPIFLKLFPKMIRNRKIIMQKAKVGPKEMRRWFR